MNPFTSHCSVVRPEGAIPTPRQVTLEVKRPDLSLWQGGPEADAKLDAMIAAEERQHALDKLAEEQTEARAFPLRLSKHDA